MRLHLTVLAALAVSLGAATSAATVSAPRDGLIAFQRPGKAGAHDIWVVRPGGEGLRRLTAAPRDTEDYNPTWSPDGRTVLFERRGDRAGEDLRLVPAAGGNAKRLTSCTADCWGNGEARFSADGSRIAFSRASGPRPADYPSKVAIYVMSADGSDPRQLTDPPKGYEDHYPSWSPDGQTIVFQRDTTTAVAGPTELIAVDVASGTERLVYALPRWAPGAGIPTFSPDGKRVLFGYWCVYGDFCPRSALQMRNSRLATIRPDGTGLKVISMKLRADSASWSPSGKQIVFRCNDPGFGPWSLCTSKADGSHVKRFAFPWPLGSVHPSWGTHP